MKKYTGKPIPLCEFGIKIDEIRNMIDLVYKNTSPIIYLIQNADKMSIGAKNSLLKLVEEPPNNAYFIIELQQIENTLETIKSRCYEIKLENYSEEDKWQMIGKLKPNAIMEEVKILNKLDNYYQMQKVLEYGCIDFADYVYKVYENIDKVQLANSFKLEEKLDLKGDGNGYDLNIFWVMYIYFCMGDLFDLMVYPGNEQKWAKANIVGNCVSITGKYIQKLNVKRYK